ncbi:MAG: extracellular solute-binding protein [Clostridia bacterium]|nr:extracellular solute-binding protein [Clostridia bacterium]
MKKRYRFTALLLVLLTVMTLAVGCNDTPADTDTEPVTTGTQAASETELSDGLPDLNYGGDEVNILNMEYIISGPHTLNDGENAVQAQADVVQEANYYRRRAVEERLGVTINFIEETKFANIPGLVRQSVNAGSNDYDMVFTVASQQVVLMQEGLYTPISDLTYVNLDNPWWNKEYIESVSVNSDNPYILFGDITFNTVQRTCAVYFNKRILEERHGMSDDDLYQIVLDGDWTIEKMYELASTVYEDNGNSVNDAEDIHGMISFSGETYNWMAYSAGLEFTSRDEDGYPVLNLNNERTVELADKLLELLTGEHVFKTSVNNDQVTHFTDGKALFLANRLYICDWSALREMTDDYGIIPMPKYDESIDGYHSVVESLVQWGAVPVTVADYDMISAVAESMAYEGYMTVTPAYYETALKLKFTRGDDVDTEAAIIDLITTGARTDFLFMNSLDGIGKIFQQIGNSGQNNFSSLYASYELAAKGKLGELIENDRDNRQ